MRIHIYYGGRGLVEDPTLFVIGKVAEILAELNVVVERYNLHELKNSIITLPQTLKEADGVVLATTVEWYGIGGYMQQFLDSCWLYGDKDRISNMHMCPIAMATTYGERDAKLNLTTAWEILGGKSCSGICGYITNVSSMENNEEYIRIIEKVTENLYRSINQQVACFPNSNQAVKQKIAINNSVTLTPQESEQLSRYVSNDAYVQKQKEDLQELASMFRGMMESHEGDKDSPYISRFEEKFVPEEGFVADYKLRLKNRKKTLIIQVDGAKLSCHYGDLEKADVEITIDDETINEILSGRMTFQRAFMSGRMKMKGDYKALRSLDNIFRFS